MPTPEMITLSVSIILAVLGWWIAHYQSQQQDIQEQRRASRITHLREAYLILCEMADYGVSEKNIRDIQRAWNDIQLIADPKHYHMLGKIVDELNRNQSASLDTLLTNLRDDIRAELSLPGMPGPRIWIRLNAGGGNDA